MSSNKKFNWALLIVIVLYTIFFITVLLVRHNKKNAQENVSRETMRVIILHTPESWHTDLPDPTQTPEFTVKPMHTHKIEITEISEVTVEPTEVPTETPSPTEVITEIPQITEEPVESTKIYLSSRSDDGWLPYLATSYSAKPGSVGNRGESLDGKNVIAMWQTDMDYARLYTDMIEPFKSFFKRTDGVEYGSLPYGTEVEMRIWTGSEYKYLGVYKVLDDSPTTQYNLSNVAVNLHGNKSPLYFNFTWTDTNYRGQPAKSGERRGQISNWKSDYSWNVKGWLDVLGADWGMVIVEIKLV